MTPPIVLMVSSFSLILDDSESQFELTKEELTIILAVGVPCLVLPLICCFLICCCAYIGISLYCLMKKKKSSTANMNRVMTFEGTQTALNISHMKTDNKTK